MDRDSTGETPSALCPPQEAGFTLNNTTGYSIRKGWVRENLYKNRRDRSNGRLTKQLDLSTFFLPRTDLMLT